MRKRMAALSMAGFVLCQTIVPGTVHAAQTLQRKEDAGDFIIYMANHGGDETQDFMAGLNPIKLTDKAGDTIYQAQLDAETVDSLTEKKNILVEENIDFSVSAESSDIWLTDADMEAENIPMDELGWNYEMIHASEQSVMPAEDDRIRVAVMDSGVDLISGVPVKERVNLVEGEQDFTFYMEDMSGHGTAVANIITQINENADIYSVRVMNKDNQADLSSVIKGIYWCIDQDVDIINMSFGTPTHSEILKKAIDDAAAHGILLIAAAGNDKEAGLEYPAAYNNVMAVASVDDMATKAELSAEGDIDVTAPGEDIHAISMFGLHTWADGTSMSAAHVTGAASIIWQKDRGKSKEFVQALLQASSNPLGVREEYGNGLVDIDYAMRQYDSFAEGFENIRIADSEEEQIIPENKNEVVTFESRWKEASHHAGVTLGDQKTGGGLNSTELGIMKAGSMHPDVYRNDTAMNTYWHGAMGLKNDFNHNYIANYRFITKMASMIEDTDPIDMNKGVDGQTDVAFKNMRAAISITKGVGGRAWKDLIPGYDNQVNKDKIRWRKLYIYGMAIHAAMDTYAHNAYTSLARLEATKITGTAADDPWFPANENDSALPSQRLLDARLVAMKTVAAFKNDSIPGLDAFVPENVTYRGYYLGRIHEYARKAYPNSSATTIYNLFKHLEYPNDYR